MRKPTFCICENKDADQLRGNCEADQRLCFRYTDSTIPLQLNPKFQASSHLLWMYSPVCVGPGQKPRRPVFSQPGSIHVSVSVNQSFQVHAIDPDAGLNGTVIFGLDDQDSGPFQINPFSKLPLDVTPNGLFNSHQKTSFSSMK